MPCRVGRNNPHRLLLSQEPECPETVGLPCNVPALAVRPCRATVQGLQPTGIDALKPFGSLREAILYIQSKEASCIRIARLPFYQGCDEALCIDGLNSVANNHGQDRTEVVFFSPSNTYTFPEARMAAAAAEALRQWVLGLSRTLNVQIEGFGWPLGLLLNGP